jgi:hypothetical protein
MFGTMYMPIPASEPERQQHDEVLIAELKSAIAQCAHIFGNTMTNRMIRDVDEHTTRREHGRKKQKTK